MLYYYYLTVMVVGAVQLIPLSLNTVLSYIGPFTGIAHKVVIGQGIILVHTMNHRHNWHGATIQ